MAKSFDALIDSVLSEIALCGVQGAGSADFYRFVQKFYERIEDDGPSSGGSSTPSGLSSDGLGRKFYEKVWRWVSGHSDMRIIYQKEVRQYTLTEFEAAELHETGTSGGTSMVIPEQLTRTPDSESKQPSQTLLSMGGALRERARKETQSPTAKATIVTSSTSRTPPHQLRRHSSGGDHDAEPVFDDPETTVTAPRLYASQGRIWQALTGHGIDLKKVPSMEFVLLSLITARGSQGIPQTDLIRASGQDKRSVPHRTDELARKGYIVKVPVQAGKVRTSLCVHHKFASQSHFIGSSAQEDVYREDSFVLSGFVHLIYNTFKDAGVVPTRELRTRLGVPMTTWNKRATQGALVRLDQTGMIKRLSVRKKKSEDSWLTCIRILREPRDEDVMNLGFRRQGIGTGHAADEVLDDDADGDTLMRDLEVDTLEDENADVGTQANKPLSISDSDRIPPQWTPDQFVANFAFDAVALGGSDGWDSTQLRNRMFGPFWRRPLESYFTRLTDDWEKTQPLHLRHLAIIRDSRNTSEKKYLHYVYRTYGNFQKAVDAGVVHWAGVSHSTNMGPLEISSNQSAPSENTTSVDAWGFKVTHAKDLERDEGSATLSEVREAIVHRRAYGPRWDSAISHEIGHQKINETPRSLPRYSRGPQRKKRETDGKPTLQSIKLLKQKKSAPILSLSPEQRISLGLKAYGRLSKHAEKQIAEHRQKTGDPCSLPDKIEDGPSRGGQPPLMTAEERIAAGLPPRGRLGIKQENAIRVQRGLAEIPAKTKKRDQKVKSEPTVLSKQQRIKLKWNDHGRLPQDLIEGLRQERKEGIALKDSKVIALYDEVMKAAKITKDMKEAAKAGKTYVPEPTESIEDADQQGALAEGKSAGSAEQANDRTAASSHALGDEIASPEPVAEKTSALGTVADEDITSIQEAEEATPLTPIADATTSITPAAEVPISLVATANPGKRKASSSGARPKTPKRRRTQYAIVQHTRSEEAPPVPETSGNNVSPPQSSQVQSFTAALDLPMTDVDDAGHINRGCNAQDEVQHAVHLQDIDCTEASQAATSSAPTARSSPDHQQSQVLVRPNAGTQEPETAPSPASITETASAATKSFIPLTLVPPDIHKLKISEKARYRQYTERSSPGVYFDKFSKYKAPRGRPRKASIATFRLSGLSNFEWFRLEPSTSQHLRERTPAQPEMSSIPEATSRANVGAQLTGGVDKHTETISNVPQHSVTIASTPREHTQFTSRTLATGQEPSLRENGVADSHGDQNGAQSSVSNQIHEVDSPSTHAVTQVPVEQTVDKSSTSVARSAVETVQTQSNSVLLPPRRTVAGWTVVNGSVQSSQSSYESPYGPSINSSVAAQPQLLNDPTVSATKLTGAAADALSNSAPAPYSSTSWLRKTSSGPNKPKPRAPRKRTRKQQIVGSALFFRRQIIWDIIDMCKGVFPDQGEIGRPFSKLWDERHGHVQGLEKPIASTVNETMRNMCTNPAFGIKRMVFQVRMNYKRGPFVTKKAIIARTHLGASSPEVLKLAQNITNNSHERSQQYFPDEVRHLIDETSLYWPVPRAPKDESIVLNPNPGELEDQIKEARKLRRRRLAEQKKLTAEARKAQNARVEEIATRKDTDSVGGPQGKRMRLASLNDKDKRYRRIPQPKVAVVVNEDSEDTTDSEEVALRIESGQSPALIWTDPVIGPTPTRIPTIADMDPSTSDDEGSEEELPQSPVTETQENFVADAEPSTVLDDATATLPKSKKRVRIAEPASQLSRKKPRTTAAADAPVLGTEYIENASAETDVSVSSEVEESADDAQAQTMSKPKKRSYKPRHGRGKAGPLPTLLERLTGLTGDPNDPIYIPPDRHRTRTNRSRPRSELKKKQHSKKRSEHKIAESSDALHRFKKLCCTLVIATSMSAEEGVADWSIVERVYSSDKLFDVPKTKKIWAWMQSEMAPQVADLTDNFQNLFLEAYEQGHLSPIEDPSTYDWASLARWATESCTYPELPLPLLREALQKFTVDESDYAVLDRAKWYKDKVADRSRTLLQLQLSFVAPLHRARKTSWSPEDKTLKARSWIRANTATPQALYNGKQAHDKLMRLGQAALVSVVEDFVEKRNLKMRKLKRLLPGRNYNFTPVLAKKYVRHFELGDLMSAVKVKKEMDNAFAKDDPSKRFYSISRLEDDGPIAAIMSMVSARMVKLVPQLPPVNNEFGAPLPRLSIWGFCEGDYIHRAIDRERLFWDIYVVPTDRYLFGNPLQPSLHSYDSIETQEFPDWKNLPEPPLPGKHDPDALLPIWSSIDGQSVIWPWWYRILNLVLQPLIFQPGATSSDIYSHCPPHTTEIFEIELVLSWLQSVNAVRKTFGGGYITQPGWWAAFGDNLKDVDDDWFGEHVKKKSKRQEKQQWREQYNVQHSALQTRGMQESAGEIAILQVEHVQKEGEGGMSTDTTQQILENPKKQYSITQEALEASETGREREGPTSAGTKNQSATLEQKEKSFVAEPRPADAPAQNVVMVNVDAEGHEDAEDIDAEGEIDDAMY
ncbi:hypothetical protein J1614_003192 [Plenodomus biglobosus]|nr:hypothetical protein J1614_003192 [Plenodomus biglobosus]